MKKLMQMDVIVLKDVKINIVDAKKLEEYVHLYVDVKAVKIIRQN